MSEFTAGFIREKGMPSPDRVDALVWAVSDLLFKPPSGVIVVKR
jgi:phage terminase large subunit-like protein